MPRVDINKSRISWYIVVALPVALHVVVLTCAILTQKSIKYDVLAICPICGTVSNTAMIIVRGIGSSRKK
jgi:hypothetical protein